jgi:secreted PhoX family phosphatase
MFPALKERQDTTGFKDMTEELVDIEMAAHGVTVVEIARDGEDWAVVLDSPHNRRISPLTEMAADGPAAGDKRLQTSGDPSGKTLVGTLNNCAGGVTPWNTYLTAEENFHFYFWTDQRGADNKPARGVGGDQAESYARYGVPAFWQAWGKFHDRFNVDKEPNEPNRFGWIVEIDPFDPNFVPVKHTALGRFCHEGAETVLNRDGRVVVYAATTRAGSMSIASSATASTARTTAPPTCRCCRRARSTPPDSTPTAQANGCRSFSARQSSLRSPGSSPKPMC